MLRFWRILSAERLKLSRSSIWLLVVISPVIALPVGALADMRQDGVAVSWQVLLNVMSLMHALLFLPVLTGLFAALICRSEHSEGGWKMLLSLPVTRTSLYLAKFTIIMLLLALVQLLFLAALLGMGMYRGAEGPVPWPLLFSSVLGGWFACLPLAALQLGVSQGWSSFGAPLALNVSLTIPNILVVNSATYAPYYPWAQPLLAMSPFGGDEFGAFVLPAQTLMLVVSVSLILFLGAGLLAFRHKAV
ncbi:ABC transporter permease [Paenibacillus sp. FSL R7-0345]|uniref:ABC transporter permease n=1 Tax=Paenibacillus sp. FSL R7-0345 TaxID=2954535 RepID=UPI00315AACE5